MQLYEGLFSEGKLNRSMAEKAAANLKNEGYNTQMTTIRDDYDVEKEIPVLHKDPVDRLSLIRQ